MWRLVLVVWAVAVAGGGLLTLWLRASVEPPPPTGWYNTEQDGPGAPGPPLPSGPATPPCPSADDGRAVLCVYATAR
ncbi:hypothetical protein ABZ871_19900 [Streptomyces populi]